MTTNTAIISKVTVGRVDHYKDIMTSILFDMNGITTSLCFTMDETLKMMKDVKLYNDVQSLEGLPCEIEIDDKRTCHFKGMWEK